MIEVIVVVDRIARAAFAASGAYLVGSFAFRLLGALVGEDIGELEGPNRKEVISK